MRITIDMAGCESDKGRALVAQLEVMGFVMLPAEIVDNPLLVYAYKRDTDPTDLIYAKQKIARFGCKYVTVTGENMPELDE